MNGMSMNNINPCWKVHHLMSFFLLMSFLIGQETGRMSSDWTDVRGRSPEDVKIIIRKETRKIQIKSDKVIDKAVGRIEAENDERMSSFNNKKADLRAGLNLAIDEKNAVAMAVNDLKDDVALKRSELMNYRQKIGNADGSIANSKQLIQEEKDRVQDELTKIPFYEVLIGKVEDLPSDKNPIPYEDAIAYKISREAIDSQLGIDIIKKTIIQDGTLSEESVLTLLKGKANTNLTRYEDQRLDEESTVIFDLYRYGLVAVYPFQDEDVTLHKAKKLGIKVDVQAVQSAGKGLSKVLDRDNLKKLSNMINEKKLKNSDSEAQVKRLARTAKQVIRREKGKIKVAEGIIASNREKIANEEPLFNNLEIQLQEYLQEQQVANNKFNIDQNAYNNHVASEEYVTVYAGIGQATATEEKESRFSEIAANTYEDFITSIKSEYLKEEAKLTGELLSEIKESKKSDIKLNSIKIVGKFSKKEYGRINLIIYVAYNFGFEFEQAADSQLALEEATKTTAVSRSTYIKPTPSMSYNLAVTSTPSGAVVSSGGNNLGTTPLYTYLDPGLYSLVVTKDGYRKSMDVIEITSSEVATSHIVLQSLPAKEKTAVGQQKGGNKLLIWAGVAILGGGAAYYLISQQEEAPKTGSVVITIEIP